MIWLTDATGSLTFVKPEWEHLTGQPVGEALGTGWLAKVHPNDRGVVIDKLKEANKEKEQISMTYRLSLRRGDFRWVTSNVSPSHLPETGEFLGLLGTLDLTEKPVALKDDPAFDHRPWLPPDSQADAATVIEALADHVMYARQLAATARESVITSILDLALIEIGYRLAADEADNEAS